MPPASGTALRVKLGDGQEMVLRRADISPNLVKELRALTGLSFRGHMQAMQTDPDIDILAGLIWLFRRCQGEKVDLASIEAGLDYEAFQDVELEVIEDDGEGGDPEA